MIMCVMYAYLVLTPFAFLKTFPFHNNEPNLNFTRLYHCPLVFWIYTWFPKKDFPSIYEILTMLRRQESARQSKISGFLQIMPPRKNLFGEH